MPDFDIPRPSLPVKASRSPPRIKPKPSDPSAELARLVGVNLRTTRRRLGHSLDTLARASGVSRAMLGQIETGKSGPTITLLWKVADALGVPLTSLVTRPDSKPYHIERRVGARVVGDSNWRFQRRTLTPSPEAGGADFQELRLAPGHRERFAAKTTVVQVSLVIASGTVDVAVGEELPVRLSDGDAIFFSSGVAHAIANVGPSESILFLVLSAVGKSRA